MANESADNIYHGTANAGSTPAAQFSPDVTDTTVPATETQQVQSNNVGEALLNGSGAYAQPDAGSVVARQDAAPATAETAPTPGDPTAFRATAFLQKALAEFGDCEIFDPGSTTGARPPLMTASAEQLQQAMETAMLRAEGRTDEVDLDDGGGDSQAALSPAAEASLTSLASLVPKQFIDKLRQTADRLQSA